jgi:hypothetical protein
MKVPLVTVEFGEQLQNWYGKYSNIGISFA